MKAMALLLAWAAATAVAPEPVPIVFGGETITEHLTESLAVVEVPEGSLDDYGEIDTRVTVSLEGRVTDAILVPIAPGARMPPRPAIVTERVLAAARALRFTPFNYRGVPIAAAGVLSIPVRPLVPSVAPYKPFPPIDYSDLKITLVRSACFGSCPDYRVSIDGAGAVTFSTEQASLPADAEVHRGYSRWSGVLVPGTHHAAIDRAALDRLIAAFRSARFFALKPAYQASITDNPTYQLGFATGGQRRTVVDYVGERVGMPPEVTALEKAVDETAGSARWVRGDARTVPMLIGGGFDPKSDAAVRLAMLAASEADEQVSIDLIKAGLPLDRVVPWRTTSGRLGEVLLREALDDGKGRLFASLADLGWLGRMSTAMLGQVFAATAAGCDSGIARRLVAAGADPNAKDPEAANKIGGGPTALFTAIHGYQCHDRIAVRALARELISLGADVDARDPDGESVVFGVEDPVLLDELLAAGARVDIKDKNGNSPAFGSWTDAIVLRLLDAGADPNGRYDSSGHKSLRRMAKERDMPATLAWLDAHHIS